MIMSLPNVIIKAISCLVFVLPLWASSISANSLEYGNYNFHNLSATSLRRVEERIVVDSYVFAFINYTYRDKNGEKQSFSEETARYGEGKILSAQGVLVHVTSSSNIYDNTACSADELLGTRNDALPTTKWIALVKRGGCTFEDKVRNVYEKGAMGVIIYNDKGANNLEKMQIKDKDRNIAAVFTFKWIGEEMANIVDEGNPVFASITEGQRGMRPITTLNRTSVLFVSISFVILMIISLVWLVFYYIQRFRYLQSKDQHTRHLCTATKRVMMKIPTKHGQTDKEKENDCCAICIEVYKSTDCIRVLPCKHEFHKNCIDPWLIEHRTCPMCKLDVLKHYGFMISEESIIQIEENEDQAASATDIRNRRPERTSILPTFVIQDFGHHSREAHATNLSRNRVNPLMSPLPTRSQSSLSFTTEGLIASAYSNTLLRQHQGISMKSLNTKLRVKNNTSIKRRSRSADSYRGGVTDVRSPNRSQREHQHDNTQQVATDTRSSANNQDDNSNLMSEDASAVNTSTPIRGPTADSVSTTQNETEANE